MKILSVNQVGYTKNKSENNTKMSFGVNYTQGFKEVLAREEVGFAVKQELREIIELTSKREDGLIFDAVYHEQPQRGPKSGVGFDTIFFDIKTSEEEKPLRLYYYSNQTKKWLRAFFQDIVRFAQPKETDANKPRNLINDLIEKGYNNLYE